MLQNWQGYSQQIALTFCKKNFYQLKGYQDFILETLAWAIAA